MRLFKPQKITESFHVPVLLREVLQYFNPKPGENFIDCTLGEAGHSLAILERTRPEGKVLGIDRDAKILQEIQRRLESQYPEVLKRLILVCDNFANLEKIVEKYDFKNARGVLFDLGLSSFQIEKSGRGFSFQRNEPLSMSYSDPPELTAEKIVNEWPEEKLFRILKEYGQERFAGKITREIVRKRRISPIKTTFDLVEIIKKAIPTKYLFGRIHFATRTFQALRIAVNNELENLKKALPQALEILNPGGRLVVLSFHSLEDRIVKIFLKEKERAGFLEILTKKPVRPGLFEIKKNPRSRSARLRAAVKLSP